MTYPQKTLDSPSDMAKSEICGDCHHFSDVGRCRICATSKREYVGFFADACPLFTREPEQPAPETKKEMENEKPTTKVCKKCGRELPLEQFGKNKNGYINTCKECRSKIQKEAWAKRKPQDSAPVQEYKVKKIAPVRVRMEYKPQEENKHPFLTPEEVEVHKQDALLGILRTATDQQLAAELTRRGYRGHLTKTLINEE